MSPEALVSEGAGRPRLERGPEALHVWLFPTSPHTLPTKYPIELLLCGIIGHSSNTYSFGTLHAFEMRFFLPTILFFLLSLRPSLPTWQDEMTYKSLQTRVREPHRFWGALPLGFPRMKPFRKLLVDVRPLSLPPMTSRIHVVHGCVRVTRVFKDLCT